MDCESLTPSGGIVVEIEGKVSRMIDREEREDPRWRGVTTKKEFVVQDSSSTGRTR